MKLRILNGVLMGTIMSVIMSGFITAVNTGFEAGYLGRWAYAWAVAWVIAVPLAVLSAPMRENGPSDWPEPCDLLDRCHVCPNYAQQIGGEMQHALVIGASGGIGRAISAELAARGWRVTGLSRSADGLDVTDAASVTAHLSKLEGPFQRIIIATGALEIGNHRPEKALKHITPEAMAAQFALKRYWPGAGTGACRAPAAARRSRVGGNAFSAGRVYRGQPDRRLAQLSRGESGGEPDHPRCRDRTVTNP